MFAYLFNPTVGVVDQLLPAVAIPIVPWFGKPAAAMVAILLISLWQNAQFMMLLILAALFAIPADLYEAARMDGARWPQIVRSIGIPSVLGIVLLGVILRILVTSFAVSWLRRIEDA